jgi:DNA repair exonuclease SbcCD ATPase subunit
MFELTYKNLQVNNIEKYSENYKGNNICILKGPNDSGKTTVLSMIKLALSNFKPDNIDNEIMKEKSKIILNSPDFEMNLFISSYDNKFKIEIKYDKKKGYPEYYINNKQEGYTYLSDNLQILYEVPGEPIKKLERIIDDIKNELFDYERLLEKYRDYIYKVFEDLKNYEESEDKKTKLKNKIEDLNKKLEDYNSLQKQCEKESQEINDKYVYIKYNKLYKDIILKTSQFDNIEREIQKLKKKNKKIQKSNKKIMDYSNQIINKSNNIYYLIIQSKPLFDSFVKNDNVFYEIFEKELSSLNSREVESISVNYIVKLYNYFNNIKESVKTELERKKNSKLYLQYKIIDEIIKVLENYIENLDIKILDSNVGELLKKLYDEKEKYKKDIESVEKLDNLKNVCDSLIDELNELKNLLNTYEKEKQIESDSIEENYESQINILENRKNELWDEIDSLDKEIRKIEDKYKEIENSNKISISDIPVINDSQLSNLEKELDKYKHICENYKDKIESLNRDKDNQTNELNRLETIKKPSTTMTRDELESEYQRVDEVKEKLNKYIKLIDMLLKSDKRGFNINNSEIEFYDKLGKYISNILKYIYHLHEKYYLLNIDFINREYIVRLNEEIGEQRISFISIGTGTSALNGLLARMKQDTTGKKQIILVDEIGDMDENNLKNLIKIAEEEVKSNKLLLLLMARPESNDLNAKSKAICDSYRNLKEDETNE